MHLVATNLWTWMRYVLKEEAATASEIAKWENAKNVSEKHNHELEQCHGSNCVIGPFSEFM